MSSGYPRPITDIDHVEPVPRRIRGVIGTQVVFDTQQALYVWEWPHYPQYYVPLKDVRADLLVDEGTSQHSPRGAVASTASESATSTVRTAPRSSRTAPSRA